MWLVQGLPGQVRSIHEAGAVSDGEDGRCAGEGERSGSCGSFDCGRPLLCPREVELRRTILETIGVLEETRSAFKSKRLAALRRKLIEVLAETA